MYDGQAGHLDEAVQSLGEALELHIDLHGGKWQSLSR